VVTKDNQYAIETFSLTKVFPDWWGRARVIAVQELDLKIKYNEIYGLLGPNGSGKTTTLKMLLSLLHPTKGRALVLGGSTSDTKISAKIGYLPEDSYLYRYLTARETLDFYGRIFSLPAKVRKSRIDTLLEMVGLTGMANRAVGTYSKGMARRIGLAQALINDPEVLILDEPTSGMDPIGTRQIKDLLIQLAKRGKTILLCSHLLADVEDVCDRIGILYGGRMQIEGQVKSLLQHTDETQILTSRISESAMEKIKQIVRTERADCEITSPMDKLEEFFIRTVVAAQKQKLPTSGAVSTTEVGGFLTEQAPTILQRLVSAEVSAQQSEPETVEPGPLQKPTSEPIPQADTDLLEKLTKTVDKGVETKIVEKTLPAESFDADETEVKQDVLDELTGGDGQKNNDKSSGPEQSGENRDA